MKVNNSVYLVTGMLKTFQVRYNSMMGKDINNYAYLVTNSIHAVILRIFKSRYADNLVNLVTGAMPTGMFKILKIRKDKSMQIRINNLA